MSCCNVWPVVGIDDHDDGARAAGCEFLRDIAQRQHMDGEWLPARNPCDRLHAACGYAAAVAGEGFREQALQGGILRRSRGPHAGGADRQAIGVRA